MILLATREIITTTATEIYKIKLVLCKITHILSLQFIVLEALCYTNNKCLKHSHKSPHKNSHFLKFSTNQSFYQHQLSICTDLSKAKGQLSVINTIRSFFRVQSGKWAASGCRCSHYMDTDLCSCTRRRRVPGVEVVKVAEAEVKSPSASANPRTFPKKFLHASRIPPPSPSLFKATQF